MKSFKRQPLNGELYSLKLFAIAILLLICYSSFSQKRPPQDVRRVTVTNQYVLENGKKTGMFYSAYQEIYDSLGRLHTLIEYDKNDHYPHNYTWYSFDGKLIKRSERFENEKLRLVQDFTYNTSNLINQEIIKFVKSGDTTVYAILKYVYNQFNKPIQIEAKGANGKIAFKSKSTYDSKGTELTRLVNIKKGYSPLDSIIELACKPKYDSIGRLTENLISVTKVNKSKITQTIKYSYDKKNNIIGITYLDKNGKQINREERLFQESRNRLMILKYYDSDDNLVMWLEKRYEIYRTKDRRTHEIDY